MALVYPAYAAGVSILSALGYYTYTSLSNSHTLAINNAKLSGRREILSELLKFGPSRLRRMCLQAGVSFTRRDDHLEEDTEDGPEVGEDRVVSEVLINEIKETLNSELRTSLRPAVETLVRERLMREIGQDSMVMMRLQVEARMELRHELKNDFMLKREVTNEVKEEIRREWRSTGIEREMIVAARVELREEVREQLKRDLQPEVRKELRAYLESEVKLDMENDKRKASEV